MTLAKTLLSLTTVSHALVAGTFFAFSAFVMQGLAKSGGLEGAHSMQAINVAILRSPFIALFLLSTVLSLVLPVQAFVSGDSRRGLILLVAGLLFVVGVFGVTMVCNVPLNDRLAASEDRQLSSVWAEYLRVWVPWNHVRTGSSLASLAILLFVDR